MHKKEKEFTRTACRTLNSFSFLYMVSHNSEKERSVFELMAELLNDKMQELFDKIEKIVIIKKVVRRLRGCGGI